MVLVNFNEIGPYAFVVGIVIAVLAGIADVANAALLLLVMGVIVGFLNITHKEEHFFLVAAIALMFTSTAPFHLVDAVLPPLGKYLTGMLKYVALFTAPAALVVALKAVIRMARSR